MVNTFLPALFFVSQLKASNDAYMQLHRITEAEGEFYSLSFIDMDGVEICEPSEDMAPTLSR